MKRYKKWIQKAILKFNCIFSKKYTFWFQDKPNNVFTVFTLFLDARYTFLGIINLKEKKKNVAEYDTPYVGGIWCASHGCH